MIKFKELRTAIVTGLYNYLNNGEQGEGSENSEEINVIMANQFHPKPDYPYVTYTFINPMSSVVPQIGAHTVEEMEGDKIKYIRSNLENMTLSLTAVSMDTDEAHEIALKMAGWFNWSGWLYLKKNNIIVVRTEQLENRDTLIVDDYERRVGFDVRLRVPGRIDKEFEWIEKAEYKYKE